MADSTVFFIELFQVANPEWSEWYIGTWSSRRREFSTWQEAQAAIEAEASRVRDTATRWRIVKETTTREIVGNSHTSEPEGFDTSERA